MGIKTIVFCRDKLSNIVNYCTNLLYEYFCKKKIAKIKFQSIENYRIVEKILKKKKNSNKEILNKILKQKKNSKKKLKKK